MHIYSFPQYIIKTTSIFFGVVVFQCILWGTIPPLVSGFLSLVALISIGRTFGRYLIPKEQPFFQTIIGSLGFVAGLSIVLSGIYWFWHIDTLTMSLGLLLTTAPLFVLLPPPPKKRSTHKQFQFRPLYILVLFVLSADILLLSTLLTRRLGDTLISPWTLVGPKFFLLYFSATVTYLFLLKQKIPQFIHGTLTYLHYALFLCVAYIVYKHGFGFDPFIHHASEQWILDHGSITPKVPYYIGQYMLTLFGHLTTGIAIPLIDNALVPIGATLLLPTMAFVSQKKRSWLPVALLVILPLPFFIVTTPHTLALLFAALTIFWMWYEFERATRKTHILGWLFVGAACVTHAFIGIPLAIIYASATFFSEKRATPYLILYTLLLSLGVPIIFFLALGGDIALITNPLTSLPVFLRLFTQPHWYVGEHPSLLWRLLYIYKAALVPLVLLGMAVGAYLFRKDRTHNAWSLATVGALFLSALLIATTIWPKDLISYERGNYAKRLLELLTVFSLPYLLVLFQSLEKKYHTRLTQGIFAILFGSILVISWYFTYPTRDPVSLHTGYAVRDADIDAVHFINERNHGRQNYIVLTNQITGVAALGEFSFSPYLTMTDGSTQYFYSIPTGAPLYQYFRKMVYEQPKRRWMEEAMEYANVDTAYFVHTNTWAPAAEIRDEAKKEADAWWELAEGRIWVYEYTK